MVRMPPLPWLASVHISFSVSYSIDTVATVYRFSRILLRVHTGLSSIASGGVSFRVLFLLGVQGIRGTKLLLFPLGVVVRQ
jgi:hypothetical protein